MLLVELQEGAVLTVGSGSPEQLSLGLWVSHRSRGRTAVLGLGRNLLSWAFPGSRELPSHGPEPAALGTWGQVKGTKRHPWSCHALGSTLCLSKHPHGQTSPVSIQDFVFPGCRERQMSVSLGLAGRLFVFGIPNWAELSSAGAQLREGCWGSPSDLTRDVASDTCATCQFLDSFTWTDGNQSTVAPSRELRTLMEHESLEGCSSAGAGGGLAAPWSGNRAMYVCDGEALNSLLIQRPF